MVGAMADSTTPATAPATPPSDTSKLWDMLLQGVQSAVRLRVTTVIGEVSLTGGIDNPDIGFADSKAPNSNVIATSVNLVDGDITNVVPERFWSPDKEAIRNYHEQQVANGHEIVRRNLQLVSEIGEALIGTVSQLKNLQK